MIWADLHTHTTCSDGSMSPTELVRNARKIGLRALAITDHDTVDGYEEGRVAAEKEGLILGTGVEFSCEFHGHSVHILGYGFDWRHLKIQELCKRHQKRREDRNRTILQQLEQYHISIPYEEVLERAHGATASSISCCKTIGRPHIAEMMVEKGYVKNLREAFHLYLGEEGKCYVRGNPFSVLEAIEVVHAASGKVFIAHPQLLPGDFPLDSFLQCPFDGIECWYAKLVQKKWISLAKKRGWMMSGGSDFHGVVKPEAVLGSNGVDEHTFHLIFGRDW